MLMAHGVTHAGRDRKTNEDALLWDLDLGLFVVADGMGGHAAGEVASALAVEAIRGFLARSRGDEDFTWPYGIDPTLSFPGNRLMTAIRLANRRIFKAGESRDDYTGLGTTAVVALVDDGHLTFTGVGDSRIYGLSDGRLEQLTRDDTWVATVLAREPGLDDRARASHPMRHVLTNVLGAREQIEMTVSERPIAGELTLLLCSDGLHEALDDRVLAEVLGRGASVEAAAGELVQRAIATGVRDNITALVVRVEPAADAVERAAG
jgi:protein phosphatase